MLSEKIAELEKALKVTDKPDCHDGLYFLKDFLACRRLFIFCVQVHVFGTEILGTLPWCFRKGDFQKFGCAKTLFLSLVNKKIENRFFFNIGSFPKTLFSIKNYGVVDSVLVLSLMIV